MITSLWAVVQATFRADAPDASVSIEETLLTLEGTVREGIYPLKLYL